MYIQYVIKTSEKRIQTLFLPSFPSIKLIF